MILSLILLLLPGMSHNAQAGTEGDSFLALSICTEDKYYLQIFSLSLVCLLAPGPKQVDRLSQETMACFHKINH